MIDTYLPRKVPLNKRVTCSLASDGWPHADLREMAIVRSGDGVVVLRNWRPQVDCIIVENYAGCDYT